jgi:hypothetical protein
MIPTKPKKFNESSLENIMFNSLKQLPDDYYVFHSFKIATEKEGVFYENEADFVIFNGNKGILVIEAKAGQVEYKDGRWCYGSGIPMSHDGPFNQASSNKWKLIQYIKNSKYRGLIIKCKFLHAVWFPSIEENGLKKKYLPPEADIEIVLTKNSIENPKKYIEKIFDIELPNRIKTRLNKNERKQILDYILCPAFKVIPSISLDIDLKKIAFHRLLKEQSALLNYLEEQSCAVINGNAGTGKTMIAIEKAKRHAADGDKVLFLCYNSKLKDHLVDNYSYENIDYLTIDGFCCKICDSNTIDYQRLKSSLEDQYYGGIFKYKHVIIDEGQDFGQDNIEESNIIVILKEIVTDEIINGSFYMFYDSLQLVQGKRIPEYIRDADCKLTLYKNCRNTENIAETSMRSFVNKKPRVYEGCVRGTTPKIHYYNYNDKIENILDRILKDLSNSGISDVVILTCKTENDSILTFAEREKINKNEFTFTTCRKFKGLEADAVILVDVDYNTFIDENAKLFYVGASRARLKLDVIASISDKECNDLLMHLGHKTKPRKPQKEFATVMNALMVKKR